MPQSIDGYRYPGYYLPEDRAKRITYLLDAKVKWSKEDVSKMICDNTSMVSANVAHDLVSYIKNDKFTKNENEAFNLLQKWNGSNNVDDIEPTIYNKFIFYYLKNTFKDEMGEIAFKQFLKTHVMKQSLDHQTRNETSLWWG